MSWFLSWLVVNDGRVSEDKISLINPFTSAQIDLSHWDRTHNIKRVALSSAPTDPNCTVITTLDDSIIMEWTMEESDSIITDALVFRESLYILG